MILKLLYKLFPKAFNKLFASTQSKPIGFETMQTAFVDSNGLKYYRSANFMDTPIERRGKLNTFLMWMNMGLGTMLIEKKDGKEVQYLEIDLILDAMEKAVHDGLKTPKNAAVIGALIQEIRERRNLVIHTELLYNLLAVQWIREDEKIDVYDEEIQLQKVKQFKYEVLQGNSHFFFATTELIKLFPFLQMSENEWNQYWVESEAKQLALQKTLNDYLQKPEYANSKTTSTSN